MIPLEQHQSEILSNLRSWESKPLLRQIYSMFYERIISLIDRQMPGRIVEIGSGIGNLKAHLPEAISTDLFSNPWLDLACDGYDLPFKSGSLSHLVLFDVFHHLEVPGAFLREAKRVLNKSGRLILFEPYISWSSYPVYGLLHHEPVGWKKEISSAQTLARPRDYYAAQGNATRLFFTAEGQPWLKEWNVFHSQAFSSFSYFLSGGYSKPSLYPSNHLTTLMECDQLLSRWPRYFGGRCLIGLIPASASYSR